MRKRYVAAFGVLISASALLFAKEAPQGPVTDSIAKTYGVSSEEAQQRIALGDQAAALQERLIREEANSFGGMYIQNGPEFRIIVQFTGNAEATLAKYTQDPVFNAVRVNQSLAVLKRKQEALLRSLKDSAPQFETDIDVRRNKVKVRHPNRGRVKEKMAKDNVAEDDVEIVETNDFAVLTAVNRGGYHLSGNTTTYIEEATSGFTVVDQQGNKGVLTAAHSWECSGQPAGCISNPSITLRDHTSATHSMRYLGQMNYGSNDFAYYTATGVLFPNEIWNGSATQKIYGRYLSLMVGQTVCKYGIKTLRTCGTIESTSATHVHNGYTGFYVRVKRDTFGLMNDFGDSGGPVYSNSSAYGLVHA